MRVEGEGVGGGFGGGGRLWEEGAVKGWQYGILMAKIGKLDIEWRLEPTCRYGSTVE